MPYATDRIAVHFGTDRDAPRTDNGSDSHVVAKTPRLLEAPHHRNRPTKASGGGGFSVPDAYWRTKAARRFASPNALARHFSTIVLGVAIGFWLIY